jgi:hypothetical protein
LGGALLCVFCAVALLGWRLLDSEQRTWRRRWQAVAIVLLLAFAVTAPRQKSDLALVVHVLREEKEIQSDLHDLVGRLETTCRPISVPGVQAVPRLGRWLGLEPEDFLLFEEGEHSNRGTFLAPASAGAKVHYGAAKPPTGFRLVEENRSWRLYRRCQ